MSLIESLKDLKANGVELWLEGDCLRYSVPQKVLTPQILDDLKQHEEAICAVLRKGNNALSVYPLSHNQQALWFLQHLAPESATYNIGFAVGIRSPFDVAALSRTFQELLTRHAILRTTFPRRGPEPVQVIHPHQELCFEQIDASQWDSDELTARVADACKRPFNLEVGPLMRVMLYTHAADDHLLLLTTHRIVCDDWSLWLLLDELRVLYPAQQQGTEAPLPLPALSYKDYVRWQTQMLASPQGKRLWAYWQQQLAGELSVLNLPTSRPRPPIQSYNGASYPFTLTAELTERLRQLSEAENVTLYVTLVAAFQVLLHRYTGQEDILVGTPTASRSQPDFDGLVGAVMNTVVLRGSLTGNLSFTTFLRQVWQTVMGALLHQDFPFTLLVDRLELDRDPSRSPLYQVMFNLLTPPQSREMGALWRARETGERVTWGRLALEPLALAQGEGQLDLTLEMVEGQSSLSGAFKYNTDLFDAATITRMAGHFQVLLEGIVAHSEQRLAALPLLTELEQHQLLVQWNTTTAYYPQDKRIHQLFEDQVQRTPEAIAGVFEGQQCTYHQLNAKADQVARQLWQAGVQGNALVGLCMERSLEMLVGLLGILKSGAAYLPLDPDHPQKRLDFILQDAGATVLVTQSAVLARLPFNTLARKATNIAAHAPSIADPSLCIVHLETQKIDSANGGNFRPPQEAQLDDLAYVIYTSGSTGTPKGVQIPHRAVVNFLTSMAREPGMTVQDALLAVTTPSFDIAGLELLLPLTVGGRVVIAPRAAVIDGWQLAKLLHDSGATIMQATPATWRLLIASGWEGESHLKILCGGEALPPELARELLPRCCSLWNMYGPTETTIWSTTCRILSADRITIGRPIANTEVYVLSEDSQPVPIGVPGELYIGGDGLAAGYLNRPDLTTQRFVSYPLSTKPGARLYKTGDIAAYAPDGQLRYLGRADHQVKIRGYRVELGEIEMLISRHPAVSAVVVVAREVTPGDSQLVAYIVADKSHPLSTDILRNYLKEGLPEYMVPSIFVALESFPLNPSGKIDRHALPLPEQSRPALLPAYAAPQTVNEKLLVEIWSALLGLEKVSVEDNLFHLGAHSLTCVRLASEISKRLAIRVPVSTFFQYPTIKELSRAIDLLQGISHPSTDLQDTVEKDTHETSNLHETGSYESTPSDLKEFTSPEEGIFGGVKNRLLQLLARIAPRKLRVILHRWRGVDIGSNVYIGYDAIVETSRPWLVSIGNDSGIGIRTTIIGHFASMEKTSLKRGNYSVIIGNKAWVGPGAVILPNVTIGDGAVVAAGSIVTTSIPAGVFAQGNPAKAIAKCGIPLADDITLDEFLKHLEPLS
jgi:amino acid adenylation domain-containing protein